MKDYKGRFRREAITEFRAYLSQKWCRNVSMAEVSQFFGIIRNNLDNYMRDDDDPKKNEPKFSTILRMIERSGKDFSFWVIGGVQYETIE